MIQNVFLPEKIGNYYLFKERIVGIDITKSHIHASLVVARGNKVTIEKYVSEPLNSESQAQEERIIASLPKVIEKIGSYSRIHTALPSSVVVFKELRLPFLTRDKIEKVIHFEVEPLLPFPAQEAVIDFIITKSNEQEKSSQILVAAVQKRHLAEHLSLFEQAGINPTVVTVDMFALYGLYSQIPSYQLLSGSVALVDLNMQTTSIVIIYEGILRIIRTLPYGMASVAKNGGTSEMKPQQLMDHLIRFGSQEGGSKDMSEAVKKSLSLFFDKVQFALQSTLSQLQSNKIDKVIFVGSGAEIKNIDSFAKEKLGATCETFDLKKLSEHKDYAVSKGITIPQTGILSTAYALPVPLLDHFNFRIGEFAPSQSCLFLKQFITAAVLLITLFAMLITHTIMQTRALRSEMSASESETIETLKERFPNIPEEEDDLDEVVKTAKSELDQEELIWRAFSSKTRSSFLEYLLELTSRINKQELGFVPEQIIITDGAQGEITLKAKVRDYEALKQLEKALNESKLFSYVEGQKTPDFTMKILAKRIM